VATHNAFIDSIDPKWSSLGLWSPLRNNVELLGQPSFAQAVEQMLRILGPLEQS
jgi:hypothetical protein